MSDKRRVRGVDILSYAIAGVIAALAGGSLLLMGLRR